MSHVAVVLKEQARLFKTCASYNAVAASLFAGGSTGTIFWAINGLNPVASVICISLSIIGTVVFGIKIPGALERHTWMRELTRIKMDVAVSLNMFPERSEHDAIVASIRTKDAWERLENKIVGAYYTDEQVLQFYKRLRQVNGVASIRFSEASFAIETVSSHYEYLKIKDELKEIDQLTKRVQERYREVMSIHTHGRRFDISPNGLKRMLAGSSLMANWHFNGSKEIIDVVLKREGIAPSEYTRIINALARLQPLITGLLVSSSKRREALFEAELVNIEIESYASDNDFMSAGYTRIAP